MKTQMSVMLSNHHVHLTEEDMKTLYGENYTFSKVKQLGPTNYVTDVTAAVIGPKGEITGLRVLGPNRRATQVELLQADLYRLGLQDVPVRESADPETAAVVTVRGSAGEVTKRCAIVAQRHVHIGNEITEEYGLTDAASVRLKTAGPRSVIFENTLVRVGKGAKCVVHLDTEEGNAAGLKNGDLVEILHETDAQP